MTQYLYLLTLCSSLLCHSLAFADSPENTNPAPPASIAEAEDKQQSAAKKNKKKPHAGLPQHEIIVGEPLPPLVIEEYGELLINDEEIHYQPWRSDKALNRVHLIHYLAGRRSASKRHLNFNDQLEALKLDLAKHHVTTIINVDDAFLGTSPFIAARLDDNKWEFPEFSIVGDKTGLGAHTWSLKRKGSAIIIVAADGTVLFFKQNKFKQDEIDSTLELLQSQMAP